MSPPIPTLQFERTFWTRRFARVAGIETGRGAWASPVVAGAVHEFGTITV